jgi:hypothetical protein
VKNAVIVFLSYISQIAKLLRKYQRHISFSTAFLE